MPKILIVDFDKTLGYSPNFPGIEKPKWIHKLVARYVKRKQKQGWYVILNTCREEGKLVCALDFLKTYYNLIPNKANANADWLIEEWGDCRKIAGTISIDDTQIGLIGWLLRRFG